MSWRFSSTTPSLASWWAPTASTRWRMRSWHRLMSASMTPSAASAVFWAAGWASVTAGVAGPEVAGVDVFGDDAGVRSFHLR
jgi:hypothetical protein